MAMSGLRASIDRRRVGYVSMLIVATLVLGAGCCLFDGHADDHAGLDVCFGMLAIAVVTVLLCGLLQSGMLPALAPASLAGMTLHVLDPPPRLFL
jgi:hypothetical protein